MADILTVMRKERKGLLRPRGSRIKGYIMLGMPALLALLMPLQIGEEWLSTPFSLLISVMVAWLVVSMTIPDSFAGERERHTLATLLASRLPDKAILYGKMAVPVVFGWGVLAIAHALSLTVFNIAHWGGMPQIYARPLLLGNLGLGLLLPPIVAGLGVLISLRAATVQAAEQLLMMGLLVPIVVLQIVGAVVLSTGGAKRLEEVLATVNWTTVLFVVLAGLLVAALVLLWAAMVRFQRARLILD